VCGCLLVVTVGLCEGSSLAQLRDAAHAVARDFDASCQRALAWVHVEAAAQEMGAYEKVVDPATRVHGPYFGRRTLDMLAKWVGKFAVLSEDTEACFQVDHTGFPYVDQALTVMREANVKRIWLPNEILESDSAVTCYQQVLMLNQEEAGRLRPEISLLRINEHRARQGYRCMASSEGPAFIAPGRFAHSQRSEIEPYRLYVSPLAPPDSRWSHHRTRVKAETPSSQATQARQTPGDGAPAKRAATEPRVSPSKRQRKKRRRNSTGTAEVEQRKPAAADPATTTNGSVANGDDAQILYLVCAEIASSYRTAFDAQDTGADCSDTIKKTRALAARAMSIAVEQPELTKYSIEVDKIERRYHSAFQGKDSTAVDAAEELVEKLKASLEPLLG